MASLEDERVMVLEKFNGTNFNLWKFKMNLALSSMDLWEIVEGTEEAPPCDASDKDKKEYQRRVRNAMSRLASTWWMRNLRTSRVAKDQRKHGGCFATFMRQEAWPTSSS